MADQTLWNESQFQAPPSTIEAYTADSKGNLTVRRDARAGVTIYDACGVCALALAESSLASYSSTMHLFAKMAPRKLCDNTGRTTPAAIASMARLDGFIVPAGGQIAFNASGISESDWRHFLAYHTSAGAKVIVETLEGCQLFDSISTEHEDAALTGPNRLRRHFFVVHRANTAPSAPEFPGHDGLPPGYICSDGCNNLMNPVINGVRHRVLAGRQPLYYAYTTVRASQPAALVAIYPKPAAAAPVVAAAPKPTATTVTSTVATATTVTVTLTAAELQALESLLAQLPHS